MNINNSSSFVNRSLLNLNNVNKINEEVVEKSVDNINLANNEVNPQELLPIQNNDLILLNNGVKINFVSLNRDSVEITQFNEEIKGLDENSETDVNSKNEPILENSSDAKNGFFKRLFNSIVRVVSKVVGFILNPIGTAIATGAEIATSCAQRGLKGIVESLFGITIGDSHNKKGVGMVDEY